MRFLVDANVLSEPTRPDPAPAVVAWLRGNEPELVVDSVILGEVRLGILLLPRGRRRASLERWFEGGVRGLDCVPWDGTTALRWAELVARLRIAGKSIPLMDSLIAATALTHDLTVATRNGRDFKAAGVRVVDPFEA